VKVFGRVRGSRVIFVLAAILASSSLALCGEIHEAVKNNDTAKVRELIKNNPDLVLSKDEDGFTPLHLAAANGYKGLVEFLLTTKAEVNAKDNAGSTPLHQAATAEGEHTDLVEVLLAHKADVNAADKHGLTPLHYATLANNRGVVKALLDHGAKSRLLVESRPLAGIHSYKSWPQVSLVYTLSFIANGVLYGILGLLIGLAKNLVMRPR